MLWVECVVCGPWALNTFDIHLVVKILEQVNVLVHSTAWIWLGFDTIYYVSTPSTAIFKQLPLIFYGPKLIYAEHVTVKIMVKVLAAG